MVNNYRYEDQLESALLYSRFLVREDALLWEEFFKDPDATELFPASFFSANGNDSAIWIDRQIDRYAKKQFGLQALIDKRTGEFVGQCGLLLQEIDGLSEVEVGYHIFKKHWGKGYAPEAAKLFMEYAFQNQLSDSVISIINQKNIKSQRVAEKNGLKIDKETVWRGLDVFIYRIKKA